MRSQDTLKANACGYATIPPSAAARGYAIKFRETL